jgi:uncharacterized protein YlxP (DUF503 family)
MVVGVLRLVLYVPENHSLKGKRSILRAVKSRVRRKFNVSIAECEDHDNWQRITIGVAQMGNERTHVDRSLREVAIFIAEMGVAELGEETYEFENF